MLDNYQASDGYDGALALHAQERIILDYMVNAGKDCCSVTGIISAKEADTMLVTVSPVIPKDTNALSSLVEKKTVHLVATIVKSEIKTTIYTCIHDIGSVQHLTYISVTNDYIT
ncbi:hypothetical protein BDF21DRAFT_403840 [Thamnidium elegans]|uniref:Uncharacterized protein n=1 Tax=Thamnidium elegans TaxID=101142 RepID=A0A8H7SXR3_9FUNG|nr:hypothetical protein INT48_008352 [Thamnidium elegans]KAI8054749.1 hypothetical protein BDF21DRAFT_403840 [Thamnidium elegans]